jgi:uncharacterized protein (TIGR01244 family)
MPIANAVLVLLLQAPSTEAPSNPAAGTAPPIRNFLKVSEDFCTAGQPRPEHFAELKAGGLKSVLNLRTPEEHRAADEQASVETAGLRYFNIPVVFTNPQDEQVDAFLKLTDDAANRPMLIHCAAAVRVGAFFMIRRVLRDGWTWDAAREEARRIGLERAPHLDEFAQRYIAARSK